MTDIAHLLQDSDTTIAVVGATDNRSKYGSIIYRDLKAKGFAVYPVNTRRSNVDGDPAYPTLGDLPQPPTIVNIVVPPRRDPGRPGTGVRAGLCQRVDSAGSGERGRLRLPGDPRFQRPRRRLHHDPQPLPRIRAVSPLLPGVRELIGHERVGPGSEVVGDRGGIAFLTQMDDARSDDRQLCSPPLFHDGCHGREEIA